MLDRFSGLKGRPVLFEALRTQSIIGDDAALSKLIAASVEVEGFKAGTVVMQEVGTNNDLCFVLAGMVSVRVLGCEIAVRTAGQHVGEMALVDPGQKRSATAVVEDGVVIARLTERSFTALAESRSRLWRNLAHELAHRLRQRNKIRRAGEFAPRPVHRVFGRVNSHRRYAPCRAQVRPDRGRGVD